MLGKECWSERMPVFQISLGSDPLLANNFKIMMGVGEGGRAGQEDRHSPSW